MLLARSSMSTLSKSLLLPVLLAGLLPAQVPVRFRIDDAQLDEYVERILPAVERAAGRKFEHTPVYEIAGATDIVRALESEVRETYLSLFAGEPRPRVERLAASHAAEGAGSLLGKYGLETKILYMVPDVIDTYLDSYEFDRAYAEDLFQLVVAHELVHALQDQVLDLETRFASITDWDAYFGFNCLIEGHAEHVTALVAEELDLEEALSVMDWIAGTDPVEHLPVGTEFVQRSQRTTIETQYLKGREFIDFQHDLGGANRVWRILQSQAPSTAMIYRPGTYRPEWSRELDLSPVLANTGRFFGRGRWLVARGNLPEVNLRSESKEVEDDLESVLDRYRGGYYIEAYGPTPALRGSAYVMEFSTASWARKFVGLAERAAWIDALWLQSWVDDGRVIRIDQDAPPRVEGVEGKRFYQSSAGARLFSGELFWFRRGRYVLQVTSHSFRMKDGDLVELVGEVFAKLGK